jgi:hypothetical protein
VRHQPDHLDVPQHPQHLVVQGEALLGAKALHPIKAQIDVIGEALGFLAAGVVAALGSTGPVQRSAGIDGFTV